MVQLQRILTLLSGRSSAILSSLHSWHLYSLQFSISQLAVSGLKVNRLDMYGEKYKPFKGVKYLTKAGRFQVRM